MTWRPGQSGNPSGGNFAKDKPFTDALRLAVFTEIKRGEHKGTTRLRAIAEQVAQRAVAGEPWAIEMVANRLEGRPVQPSENKVEMDASELFLRILHRMQPPRPELKVIEHADGQDQIAAGSK